MIHRTLRLSVDCSICGSKEDHMSSLCFEMFLFMHKIVFQNKKKIIIWQERIGNNKNRNWLFSEKTVSSKKKKSESLLDLMVVME